MKRIGRLRTFRWLHVSVFSVTTWLSASVTLRAASESGLVVQGASYDLVVYGGTPAGVAHAVRAAREGLSVLLVAPWPHLGGLLSNGLTTMDTLYNGARAPLYDEFRHSIHDYYRATYGPDSAQYHNSLPGQPKIKFEAHVAERLLTQMVERESRIKVAKGFYPVGAKREATVLRAVNFKAMEGDEILTAHAKVFSDCSYEGDLAAVAKVPYRVGREARNEFNEEHAGRIFMTHSVWPAPAHVDPAYIADYRRLNLVHYDRWYDVIRPASAGTADGNVQAYNLRTILTRDPANRVSVENPAGYDRGELLRRLQTDINWTLSRKPPSPNQPNQKVYLNDPEIVGLQRDYPEGNWTTRRWIIAEHARLTLSLIYFMQNDPTIPEATRAGWREWGLPRDEFADNGHLPYEIYVREARRIEGRATLTENDTRRAPGLERAPIHGDSISITEWFLDSHACTPERIEGSLFEGELLLNHITFPGQISYRTLLPQGLDNLLVPVCASSSHIGWGAIRLEPTWMSLAEAAAHATVLAIRGNKTPADIDSDELVRLLADRRVMISFFNDVEVDPREPWVPAVQYFGAQGFFGSYEADPLDVLTAPVAEIWAAAAAEWVRDVPVDVNERARRVLAAQEQGGEPLTVEQFGEMLSRVFAQASLPLSFDALLAEVQLAKAIRLSRGTACRLIFALGHKPRTQL